MTILIGEKQMKVENKAVVTFINNKKVQYNAKDIKVLYLSPQNAVSIEVS